MIVAFFEIMGGLVRYASMRIYCTLVKKKYKKLSYYLEDEEGEIFKNVSADYFNGIIGFLVFVSILTILYFFL